MVDRGQPNNLDTRALELAASASAVVQQHLVECRDRYVALAAQCVALDSKLDNLNKLLFRGVAALVSLLITVLGYLIARGGIPTIH